MIANAKRIPMHYMKDVFDNVKVFEVYALNMQKTVIEDSFSSDNQQNDLIPFHEGNGDDDPGWLCSSIYFEC